MIVLLSFIYFLHCSSADVNNKKFPENFSFGVATASYQIEGSWNVDGKSPSIWDTFTHQVPSTIADNSTADVTCDSYRLYETDIDLLKNLGVTHYRFSLAWTRILPNGFADDINELGVQYYQNFIKLLRQNNIEPLVTLYHWDLPQALQDLGGFLNASMADWFADYARVCFDKFGDEVKFWATFNEPLYACYGYVVKAMAPGLPSPAQNQYVCGHNLLRAHAAAWHVYDEEFRKDQEGHVSMVTTTTWAEPASEEPEDVRAADTFEQFYIGYFSDPCYFGDYPEIMKSRIANRSNLEGFESSRLPEFTEEEKASLKGTCDFYGLNNYNTVTVKAIPEPELGESPLFETDIGVATSNSISTGRKQAYDMMKYIQKRFNDPYIIITENGLSVSNRTLEDDFRVEVIQNFLSGLRDAIDDDVKVFGYTVWSVIDNFEWALGFTMKYGLYDVDFDSENKTRTPRQSANYYKKVIENWCLSDDCEE